MDETQGIVTAVWYRLKLQLSDDDLIDEYGTDMIEYDHCHTLTNRLKKKKQFMYPYKIDEKTNEIIDSRQTLIKELTVIGCEIEYELPDFNDIFHKFISFEDDSIEIENFLPALKRKGYADAAFVYDGFIVRIRNGVEDFLDQLDQSWDIVFFTAANRAIYDGLMKQLHSYLCEIMGRDEETDDPLWKRIYFRDDCTYDFDERGKIYHHKDLTKYNRDLSKLLIVDNSSLSYKSLEPNAILIKDYYGKAVQDNELEIVLELTDQIIDMEMEYEDDNDIYIDYRYILTGIITDSQQCGMYDLNGYDRRNPDDILQSTQRFLNDLKESLMQRGKLPTTLKFGEPKGQQPAAMMVSDDELSTDADIDEGDDATPTPSPQPIDLPTVNEEEDTDDTQEVFKSLRSSMTQELKDDEGVATPNGNYDGSDDTDDDIPEPDEAKVEPSPNPSVGVTVTDEDKDKANEDEKEVVKKIGDKENLLMALPAKTRDTSKSTQISLPQGFAQKERRRHGRTHSYSISLQLKDIPRYSIGLDETDSKALGVIMQSPALRQKFSEMNEREMRKNIGNEDYDIESILTNNDGIGSRLDDTDDTEETDDSNWGDSGSEDDEKNEDTEKKVDDNVPVVAVKSSPSPPRTPSKSLKKRESLVVPQSEQSPYSVVDSALLSQKTHTVTIDTKNNDAIDDNVTNNDEEVIDDEKEKNEEVPVDQFRRRKRQSITSRQDKVILMANRDTSPQSPIGTGTGRNNKRFTMKPRPDHEKIASGMSSVFLKVCEEDIVRRVITDIIIMTLKCCKRTKINESLRAYNYNKYINKYKTEIKLGILFIFSAFLLYQIVKYCYSKRRKNFK